MATLLLPWIYVFLVGALGVSASALVVIAFVVAWWAGLIALVVVPIGAVGVFALLRVGCEIVLDFSRLPHVTQSMANRLERMESTVDGVAEDMPKIAFLRGSRRASSPPTSAQDKLQV
jgi:ABC-type multidrug transport system fused ATPase/permease subunit